MRKILSTLILVVSILLTAATTAYSKAHVFYMGVVRDDAGDPINCYEFLLVWTAIDQNGDEILVAYGTVMVGEDCPNASGSPNPNCEISTCNDETFLTDVESPECLGDIICGDAANYDEWAAARDEILGGSSRSGHSQGRTTPRQSQGHQPRMFIAFPKPASSAVSEITVNLNAPLISRYPTPQLAVYDAAGRLIRRLTLTKDDYQVKVGLPLRAGVYQVVLHSGDEVLHRQKIVKQ